MVIRAAAAAVLVGLGVMMPELHGQPIQVGDSVRVRFHACPILRGYDCGDWFQASVSSIDESVVWLTSTASGAVEVATEDIARLQRHAGRRSAFKEGAVIGAVGLGLVAAAIATSSVDDEPASCGIGSICFDSDFTVALAALGGIGVGGVIGGLVGHAIGRDHWVFGLIANDSRMRVPIIRVSLPFSGAHP